MSKETHSHAERKLLVVRAADPEAKALRAKVLRETAAERERKDTQLADKWVDENGGCIVGIDYRPVYDRLFGRARAYNAAHPEPTLRLDVCGYEYSLHHHGQQFACAGCGETGLGTEGRSVKVEVSFNDDASALGRRHQVIGLAHDETCAERAFGIWYWQEYRA